jgi:hypothetical protein
VYRLSRDNTWGLQFDSGSESCVNWSFSVDGVTKGVNDSAKQTFTDGDINDGTGSLYNITFLDFSVRGLGLAMFVKVARLTYRYPR